MLTTDGLQDKIEVLSIQELYAAALNPVSYTHLWRAPKEQLSPMEKISACCTEARNASSVCPDKVRPAISDTVTDLSLIHILYLSTETVAF